MRTIGRIVRLIWTAIWLEICSVTLAKDCAAVCRTPRSIRTAGIVAGFPAIRMTTTNVQQILSVSTEGARNSAKLIRTVASNYRWFCVSSR